MWIRSQNRKILVKCNNFYIDEKYGKEGSLYWVRGYYNDCPEEESYLLGVFNSLSIALDVLDSIQGRIIAKSSVYQMPLDEEGES